MRVIRILLVSASILCALAAALVIWTTREELSRNNVFRNEEFRPAIEFVESHRGRFGELPSVDSFEAWKITQGRENQAYFLNTSGSLASDDCPFGTIPKGGYGVTIWRGEWFECYASWLRSYSFDNALSYNIKASSVCALLSLVFALLFMRVRTRATGA